MSSRPASRSTWSRPPPPGSPHSLTTSSSSAAVVSGRFGSDALFSPTPPPPPATPPPRRLLLAHPRTPRGPLSVQLLDPGADLAHLRDRVACIVTRALRLADRVACVVALRAQSLELRENLAPARVERQQLVDGVSGAAARERRAHLVGLAAEKLQVEHRLTTAGAGAGLPSRGVAALAARLAGVCVEELGDLLRVLTHDDVRRHDRAGEAAVADRE